MGSGTQDMPGEQEEHAGNSPADITRGAIYSYYRDGIENAGGLKVKWSIRVVTGPGAEVIDPRQAEVIREILQWAHRHHKLSPPGMT